MARVASKKTPAICTKWSACIIIGFDAVLNLWDLFLGPSPSALSNLARGGSGGDPGLSSRSARTGGGRDTTSATSPLTSRRNVFIIALQKSLVSLMLGIWWDKLFAYWAAVDGGAVVNVSGSGDLRHVFTPDALKLSN